MKKAFADKFQEKTGKNLWTVLEDEFSGLTAVKAVEKLINDFGTKVHPGALNRLVQKAITEGKINKEKFSGFVTNRRKKTTPVVVEKESTESTESEEPQEPTENLHVMINGICSECGNETQFHAMKNFPTKEHFLMGLSARKCPKCNKFKTLVATCIINGVDIRKAIVSDEDGTQSEEFIDESNQIIPSPFACV